MDQNYYATRKTLIRAAQSRANGDCAKDTLTGGLCEALAAISAAKAKLRKTAPNARNYYVIGPDAFTRARNEHINRIEHLEAVYNELSDIWKPFPGGKIRNRRRNDRLYCYSHGIRSLRQD